MTTYVEDSEGKFIPASQRPDGTWRKARRVKDGYIPQEEVPLYESKGKLFAKKPALPVGMCPTVAQELKEQRLKKEQKQQTSSSTTNAAKASSNANNKQNRIPGLSNLKTNNTTKQDQHSNNVTTNSSSSSSTSSNSIETKKVPSSIKTKESLHTTTKTIATAAAVNEVTQLLASTNLDAQTELAKKLKKLRKKIREIEQIEAKIKSGELKNPEKDQMDKVGRKSVILREIEDLEKLVPADIGLNTNQFNGSINN